MVLVDGMAKALSGPEKEKLKLLLQSRTTGRAPPTTQGTDDQYINLKKIMDDLKLTCEREGGDMFLVLQDFLLSDYRNELARIVLFSDSAEGDHLR
mmetsp:Transcript_10575/g.25900  ORF Transcript_10575/g.25900 Transcript_10575/m.25900 type:complete len:96 (+) Transcript_10575:36-323(+)